MGADTCPTTGAGKRMRDGPASIHQDLLADLCAPGPVIAALVGATVVTETFRFGGHTPHAG
jgi:hypothetical protein